MPGLGAAATVAAGSNDLPPGVCMDSASTTANSNNKGKPKLDTSDPRVRKLVYSMYRDFLTAYNGEANDIISKKDPANVSQDSGVGPILESIIRQRSTQGGGTDSTEPVETQAESETTNGTAAETMPPPPPPPPMMPGRLPAVRLNSEIGQHKGPPSALASAMMKDKKPFTYTPGGIDLSEIRSPRMAKRIQMNAAAEGVTNTPKPSTNNQEQRAPCALPPAALAAMQPQMAIPVFPQGNLNEVLLNRMHNKPVNYAGPPQHQPASVPRPPPPPPPPSAPSPPPTIVPQRQPSPPSPKSPPPPPAIQTPPSPPTMPSPPPPPPPAMRAPMSPPAMQPPTSPPAIQTPTPPPVARTPPPPPERATTPKSPVPIADSYLGDSRPGSQTSNQEERRSPLDRKSPAFEGASTGVGTGCIYIPPIQSPPAPPPPPMPAVSPYKPPSSRPAGQTKAQAVSQNIGSIYIPPIGTVPSAPDTHSSGESNVSNGSIDTSRTPQSAQVAPPPQMVPIPQTPQLNKAPIPWMNSYNRLQNQQVDSPPYVHPGFFMPPWAAPPGARTIPIMMPMGPDQTDASAQFHFDTGSRPGSAGSGSTTPTGSRTPSQAATHLGRVIPIQIEREAEVRQKGAKIIPIQIEGRPPRCQTPSTPSTPAAVNPMRRVVGPPPYNSPMGLYSNQTAMDAYQRQAAEAAGAGVDRMTIRCESPRMEPAQSKSLRVIQQAAENELKRLEQMQQHHRVDLSGEDDRYVTSLLASQVDEGQLVYQTAEPRFMGGHIPSKAFKALQTALPVSPGAQDQPPQSYPTAHSAHVTHHIPIRTVSQSPTPQSQGSELQMSNQPNVPPSEQKVQEPKKYMGSNIPSRSFKILQAMTADDGQSAVGSETASSELNIADAYDDTLSPCPSTENVPISPCSSSSFPLSYSSSSEGGGSTNFDPYSNSQNAWSDMMDQGWDPYSYMWYYWWYYTSCYWAGYDMTGYEYPPGWDPNYPYCPPEFCTDYSTLSDYTTATSEAEQFNLEATNGVPSSENSSVADLYKSLSENGGESYYYSHDDARSGRLPLQNNTNNTLLGTSVPKIVIEAGGDSGREGKWCRDDRKNNVDSIKDNNNSNHNDGSTSIAPSPSTECNQKPGNPIPYKKNDCDSMMGESKNRWKLEHENSAECKQLQNGNDNDDDEEREEAQVEDSSSSSSSEDEYESCCEDVQKVIERETGPCNKPFVSQNPDHFSGAEQQQSRQRKFELHGNYNCELNANDDHHHHHGKDEDKRMGAMDEEEEDEDEKTDPGADDDNDDDYGGRVAIIEEPETPSSADDSDVAPLVNEQQRTGKSSFYSNGGLSIEEYHSEESSDSAVFDYGLKKNRLSTIDEITESRASSSLFSRNLSSELDCCVNTSNLLKENSRHQQNEAIGESEDSEESSEDELSSVSVIENKSDATRGTESKREDETTSSSEEDSSTDDDDDADDDDDDEAAGADTAVTVRLPLKLCFTKTKSYKDITTVMVGDSEIEKATESGVEEENSYSKHENEALVHSSTKYNHDNIDKLAVPVDVDDDDDDEPVVSFTLSLSRQPSREDEPQLKDKPNEGHNEKQEKSSSISRNDHDDDDDAPDIDFWAEIKGEDTPRSSTQPPKAIQAKSNQDSKEDYEEEYFETDGGFWGVIARDRSTSDFPRLRKQNEKRNESNQNSFSLEQNGEQWDPHESIDYKWEKDFNFWEKSSRTIETRRFSNFEITEDYESDSGLKPSVKKERAKKYTHHKRHSIPGLPWDRASLPPRPNNPKQSTFSIKICTNEQEIEEGNVYDKTDRDKKTDKTSSERQSIDAYQDDTDVSSSWWSNWDDNSKESGQQKLENNDEEHHHHACTTEKVEQPGGALFSTTDSEIEATFESGKESSTDISGEIKLSESECNNIGESTDGDYQSFACRQASGIETRGNGGFSSLERKNGEVKDRKSLNYSCQSDATTVTTDNEDYSSSLEIKSSLLSRGAANPEAEKLIQGSSCVSVSDENSDESSSRSSGTTIGRHDKSEIKKQTQTVISPIAATTPPTTDAKVDREDHLKSSVESTPPAPADTSIQIPISIERNVEIQHEVGERIKLNGKQHQEEHQHPTSALAINTTSSCTCLTGDRIARAENLLWRIERFLHESLSLGSEDDSGVMTDLSRQISDVDTDVDNDLNETEFLLTAAAAAKERRNINATSSKDSQHIESCNFAETISSTDHNVQTNSTSPGPTTNNNSPQVKKPRPKSDIILESSLSSKVETTTEMVEENNGVKMRSASERRALRYQRAKTHSRLFQLLQDECGRDEELDEFDYDSDVGLPPAAKETITTDCQINVESTTTTKCIHVDTMSTSSHNIHSACCGNGMDDDSNQAASPGMNDSQARRSRLLPLPIKNLLASSLSLDSNSSPSGSSGVLSPTSPVNRDQLLADIINEFHLRNQASTLRAQNQKRISSSFPSKIFKLLQHEFGEEFYQTFDCCGGVGGEDSLISPCMSTNLGGCVYDSSQGAAVVHECTIHKSESMKEFEEATSRILTNFMLRNKQKGPSSESPSSTATMSSQLLQDDSKKLNADFLEVPLRKKKANLNRDPRSPKSTKKS